VVDFQRTPSNFVGVKPASTEQQDKQEESNPGYWDSNRSG
jgi:hypothetical protein